MDISLVTENLINHAPYFVAWGLAVILGAIMVVRIGSKPEKLFLTGSCLMLGERLASFLLMSYGASLLREQGVSVASSALAVTLVSGLLTLAGFVCLVWAFWLRFWKNSPKQVEPAKEEPV